jgi:MFS family permease
MNGKSTAGLLFGWTVVLGCFIGMLGNLGQVVFTSFGVMIKPLGEAFGWGRGEVSLGLTWVMITIALAVPLAGHLIDRFGSRRIASLSILLAALVMLIAPYAVSSLGQFHLMLVVIALLGAPTNTVAYARVITAWFDRRRGLFIGIVAAGSALGFAVVPLITAWAVGFGEWKTGYTVLAALLLLLILPAVLGLIIDRPEARGLLPDGAAVLPQAAPPPQPAGLALRAAISTRTFWLLAFIVATTAFALNGILSQLVPLLTDRGASVTAAAAAASTMGISMVFTRIVVGFLLDRYFVRGVGIGVFALAAAGVAILIYAQHPMSPYLAAALMGLGMGAEADLIAFLVGRYFGLRHFGTVFGCVFTAFLLGSGLGPFVIGRAFDLSGSYAGILHVCLLLLAVAAALFSFFGPYDQYRARMRG